MAESNFGDPNRELSGIATPLDAHASLVEGVIAKHNDVAAIVASQGKDIRTLFYVAYILFACCIALGLGLLAVT